MTQIILNDDQLRALQIGAGVVEVCDVSGKIVGYFLPGSGPERALYAWASAHFDDEQVERAAAEVGGYTTEEVLARLKRL